MTNRSVFPSGGVDSFTLHLETQASDIPNIQRYQVLVQKQNRNSDEEDELSNLKVLLADKLISSDDFNKLQDCIINMENFILSEIDDHMETTITNADAEIDAKVQSVKSYLDTTDAGSIRNDLGLPTDLQTTDKSNYTNAINEVNQNINEHENNKLNPHEVTSEQIGAVPYSGATKDIDFNKVALKNMQSIRLADISDDGKYWQLVEDSSGFAALRLRKSLDNSLLLEGFRESVDGIFSLPSQPFVYTSRSSALNVSSGVDTKILFETEPNDTQTEFANNAYTPKESGVYLFITTSQWATVPSAEIYHTFYKNGSLLTSNFAGFGTKYPFFVRPIPLNAGEKIEFYIKQVNEGGSSCSLGGFSLWVVKIA